MYYGTLDIDLDVQDDDSEAALVVSLMQIGETTSTTGDR